MACAALAGIALWCAIWGLLIEPDRLVVREVNIDSPAWPDDRPPLRIAIASDLHAGAPHVDGAKLDQIVATLNAADADVIVLLGDYLIQHLPGGKPMAIDAIAARLAPLRARHGVFSVLGNHDWMGDGEGLWRALDAAGIRVLENSAAPLPGFDDAVWLAGIADDSTRTPDVRAALASVPPRATVIVATHDPGVFADVSARAALILAGHTHGGQVVLPFIGPLYIPGRAPLHHAHGLIVEDGKRMYVTGGVGTSVLPLRFLVPPELVIATLR
jgi:predicted MPP superfamily phosphohydrolase